MAKTKARFVRCNAKPYPWKQCDKCGLIIKDIQSGAMFFNPNPNALDKTICENCFEAFTRKQDESRRRWRELSAETKTDGGPSRAT